MTATSVTTGAYSARKAQRSCAISKAARYPSATPATMPTTDCFTRSNKDEASENSPLPVAAASTPKVTIAAIASLNADSLITVCATRSRIWTCRKIGTSVAGSVEASVAPSSSAMLAGTAENGNGRQAR